MKRIRLIILTIIIVTLSAACDGKVASENASENINSGSVAPDGSSEFTEDGNISGSTSLTVLPPFKANLDMQERVGNRIAGGGYIEEYNGMLYFANQEDSNKLYRMDTDFTNEQKLSDIPNDTSWLDIQFMDGKLYYLQSTEIENPDATFGWDRTLYSYDLAQGSETKVLDTSMSIYRYVVDENWIYISSGEAMELYKSRLDGSDLQLIIGPYGEPYSRFFNSLQIVNDRLFLNDMERIISFGLDYLKPGKAWDDPDLSVPEGTTLPYMFLVYNQYVFYVNSYTTEFCRFDCSDLGVVYAYADTTLSNKSNPTLKVLGEKILYFTVSEGVIYYSTFEDKLYKMDLDGNNLEFIVDGSAPNVLGNYLFFFDKDGERACVAK